MSLLFGFEGAATSERTPASSRLMAWLNRSSMAVSSTRSAKPMMEFMGVRISWLMRARNSPLARLAILAFSPAIINS